MVVDKASIRFDFGRLSCNIVPSEDVVSEILQQSHIELAAKCLLEKLENKGLY